MANYTDYLNLKKWDLTDEEDLKSKFDIEGSLNDNWDKVNEAVKASDTNIDTNTANIAALEETTETNSTDISTIKEEVENNTSSISTIETNVATNKTNIATNASNIETLQSTVGTGFYSMIAKNAGAHNSVYRGEDITDLWYDGTLSEQIAAGTFDDIFIGDYITGQSSSKKYLVADINYRLYKGDTECTTPHVLLIPEKVFTSVAMNSTDTTEGAYINSEMYTTNLEAAKEKIIADFESSHILTHRNYFANATTDDYESAGAWYDSDIELMNELMVYGSIIYHNVKHGTNIPINRTIDTSQLALFRLEKSRIVASDSSGNSRGSYWLRDVVSSASFASVNNYGYANYHSASSLCGVRPAFLIY